MAANYSLITADIMDDYSLITAAIMDVPLAQITHDRQYVCFLADNFEFMASAALAGGKRPPDKTHSAPEKKLSSRISCAWGIRCTARNSEIQATFW